jgi:hypothetical protein
MRLLVAILIAIASTTIGGALFAQSGTSSGKSAGATTAKKDGKTKPAIQITPEREAMALAFVQRNHAELADLLAALKTSQPDEYERAIRDIFRVTERLATIQERDPLQYELDVAAWTAQSRVELLAAKLKMGANEELIRQLREALQTQNSARAALLKHERERVADRLKKLDTDIARFDGDREELVNKQVKALTRAANESRPVKTIIKPASKAKKSTAIAPSTTSAP